MHWNHHVGWWLSHSKKDYQSDIPYFGRSHLGGKKKDFVLIKHHLNDTCDLGHGTVLRAGPKRHKMSVWSQISRGGHPSWDECRHSNLSTLKDKIATPSTAMGPLLRSPPAQLWVCSVSRPCRSIPPVDQLQHSATRPRQNWMILKDTPRIFSQTFGKFRIRTDFAPSVQVLLTLLSPNLWICRQFDGLLY